MKSALQRMASQGGGANINLLSNGQQMPASGVVMSSTQGQGQLIKGNSSQNASPRGACNQQEL